MKLRRACRQPFEWVLTALGWVVIPWLPRRAVTRLARGLGTAAWRLAAGPRRLARANVEAACGDMPAGPATDAIVRGAFQSFALTLLDLFWFGVFSRRRLARYVHYDASCAPCWREDGPWIFLTAHLGNWEVLGRAMAASGYATASVAAPLKNRVVDRWVNRLRRATGQRIETRRGALRALLRALRGKQSVALLIDQNVPPERGGTYVEFFGLPAPITQAPAALSRHTGAPLTFMICLHDGRGGYTVRMEVLGPVAKDADDAAVTQRVANVLERLIRATPGQWLWMYKRWKRIPSGADPARFPFYARTRA
jgi:Kdo2-lipid IVA lauroyltransferase/acyltransferase